MTVHHDEETGKVTTGRNGGELARSHDVGEATIDEHKIRKSWLKKQPDRPSGTDQYDYSRPRDNR